MTRKEKGSARESYRELSERLGIECMPASEHEAWMGTPKMPFTGQAVGAIPNGTVIEKCNTESSDSFPNGTRGRVIASTDETLEPLGFYSYVVNFDPKPGLPVLISGKRIRPVKE